MLDAFVQLILVGVPVQKKLLFSFNETSVTLCVYIVGVRQTDCVQKRCRNEWMMPIM